MKDRQTPTLHVRSHVHQGPGRRVLCWHSSDPRLLSRSWLRDRRSSALEAGMATGRDRRPATTHPGRAHSPRERWQPSGDDGRWRRSFVFTHRRASDSSMRCVCRQVRVCEVRIPFGREATCRRCGEADRPLPELWRHGLRGDGIGARTADQSQPAPGDEVAGIHPSGMPVAVGTERDLSTLTAVPLRWLSTSTV